MAEHALCLANRQQHECKFAALREDETKTTCRSRFQSLPAAKRIKDDRLDEHQRHRQADDQARL